MEHLTEPPAFTSYLDTYLTESRAASMIGIPPSILAIHRDCGTGPLYRMHDAVCEYSRREIIRWMRSTSREKMMRPVRQKSRR